VVRKPGEIWPPVKSNSGLPYKLVSCKLRSPITARHSPGGLVVIPTIIIVIIAFFSCLSRECLAHSKTALQEILAIRSLGENRLPANQIFTEGGLVQQFLPY
jgi:hypothetical protein